MPHRPTSPRAPARAPARAPLVAVLLLVGATGGCRLLSPEPREYLERELPSGVVTQYLVIPLSEGLPYASRGDRLTLHYTARLEDGTEIDSSLDTGVPVTVVLGDGSLPWGLEEGLFGMRLHSERRIVVPPALAYGVEGVPGLVPPGATVEFTVELIDVERGGPPGPVDTSEAGW